MDLLSDWAGGLNSASIKLCVNAVGEQADMHQINGDPDDTLLW